ncbi:hypothetical protein MRX96_034357 [Rhipicephalus microplus]
MAIVVAGTSIDETPDGITGWVVTTQRGKKTSGSAETTSSFGANTRKDDPRAHRGRGVTAAARVGGERAGASARRTAASHAIALGLTSSKGGVKSEKDAKTRQCSRTPVRKPQNDPLTAKMLQLESTIKLMQESMRQQQETIRK